MEFLRSRIRRNKVGDLAYLVINALLPIVLLLLVHNFDSVYLPLALVFLSKWRILALRPRFWWVNLKANAVDLMVGVSIVGLMYVAMSSLPLQIFLAVLYGVWLLYLKPRSDSTSVLLQAGVAQFLALTTLFSLSTIINDALVILGCWIIGYSVARHVVSNYDEESVDLLSVLWGLVIGQIGWLLYHWTIVYDIGLPVKIPQITLLTLVLGFVAAKLYTAARSNRLSEPLIRTTVIFSAILLLIVLIFSRWDVTI